MKETSNITFSATLNISADKLPGFSYQISPKNEIDLDYFGNLLKKYVADFPFVPLIPIWDEWCKNRDIETKLKFNGSIFSAKRLLLSFWYRIAKIGYKRIERDKYFEIWGVVEV